MTRVFVYGSLKQGYALHSALEDSKFLGTDWLDEMRLADIGAYPAMFRWPGGKDFRVYGEIYEVTNDVLKHLDLVEGVHGGFYRRETVKSTIYGDCEAYLQPYLANRYKLNLVPSGMWSGMKTLTKETVLGSPYHLYNPPPAKTPALPPPPPPAPAPAYADWGDLLDWKAEPASEKTDEVLPAKTEISRETFDDEDFRILEGGHFGG
jgi:gamma-glutamylcyclotransferase (GGCT)/AIG2-like uncharacterized protein YtfP